MGITSMLTKAAIGKAGSVNSNKAVLMLLSGGNETIPVQFNPSQYRITESAQYSQQERRSETEPAVNYNGSKLSALSVQLIFNSSEFTSVESVINSVKSLFTGGDDNDITKTINKITSLTQIDGDTHMPPWCAFVWGSLQFVGYVETVGITYTMFDSSGKPLSALVDLTMRGFNGPVSERSSPKMSPDRTKARTMTEDATIWGMADKEYGSVREWRRIAEANNIMNPLDIPVGTVLRVPSIND